MGMRGRSVKHLGLAGGLPIIERLLEKHAFTGQLPVSQPNSPNAAYAAQLEKLYQKLVEPPTAPAASEADTKVLSVPK